jgi:peptidoglycan/LPS O-acetylase OafA/YrhL
MPGDSMIHLLGAGGVLTVAWLTAASLVAAGQQAPAPGRFSSIDGLRGVLALLVFVHHGRIWFDYARGEVWGHASTAAFHFMGKGSVQLFFMITAFLFFGKLLDRRKEVDWGALYISRVMRLTPLYLVVMVAMFATVAWVSAFTLRVPIWSLSGAVVKWLLFTMGGAPDINGVDKTFIMTAGVTWSLPMEWLYYALLPVMALLLGRVVSWRWLLLLVPATIWVIARRDVVILSAPFLGGMLAAVCARSERACRWAVLPGATGLAAAFFLTAVLVIEEPFDPRSIVLLSGAFTIVACGNDCFGLLRARAARLLGAMGYGLYLMHGLLLYVVFELVLTRGRAAALPIAGHWMVVGLCSALLVLCAHAGFRWIEAPAMRRSATVHAWLVGRGKWRAAKELGST